MALATAAEAARPTMPVTSPQTFVARAEIDSSRLALERSTTPTPLMFARRMIADHGRAAKTMLPAARARHIEVPTTLDPLERNEMAELRRLKGKAFDKAYVDMQVLAHTPPGRRGRSSVLPQGRCRSCRRICG